MLYFARAISETVIIIIIIIYIDTAKLKFFSFLKIGTERGKTAKYKNEAYCKAVKSASAFGPICSLKYLKNIKSIVNMETCFLDRLRICATFLMLFFYSA